MSYPGKALDALAQIVPLVEVLDIADRRWLMDYMVRSLRPPEEPRAAPTQVVGHLDNGSEVRTGFGGDAPEQPSPTYSSCAKCGGAYSDEHYKTCPECSPKEPRREGIGSCPYYVCDLKMNHTGPCSHGKPEEPSREGCPHPYPRGDIREGFGYCPDCGASWHDDGQGWSGGTGKREGT